MESEAEYVCEHCGEEIIVPVDLSAGSEQTYTEDCPVCCAPNVLHVIVGPNGEIIVDARSEQDLL